MAAQGVKVSANGCSAMEMCEQRSHRNGLVNGCNTCAWRTRESRCQRVGKEIVLWRDPLNLQLLGIYNRKAPVRVGNIHRKENHVHLVELLYKLHASELVRLKRGTETADRIR